MNTGKVSVRAIEILCPYCGEALDEPRTGSYMITSDTELERGQVVNCYACKQNFKLPKHGLLRDHEATARFKERFPE